jgi:hypothetical protein
MGRMGASKIIAFVLWKQERQRGCSFRACRRPRSLPRIVMGILAELDGRDYCGIS